MKKSVLYTLSLTTIVYILLQILCYFFDPYGYNNRKNKFDSDLCYTNKPIVLNNKLVRSSGYFLVGTSRVMRINPLLAEKYTNKSTCNINISGITIAEEFEVLKKVKLKNSNFIAGFDDFSLNEDYAKRPEIINRAKQYHEILKEDHYLFSLDEVLLTLKIIIKKTLHKDYFASEKKENTTNYPFTVQAIKHDAVDGELRNYQPDFSAIKAVAELGKKNDIFIIFPKYEYNYFIYNQHGIDKKYFNAVKLLLKHTNAQVWSFYGFNSINANKDNFDTNGYHFKPKISRLIFARIFNDKNISVPSDFGVKLTNQNIEDYLSNLQAEQEKWELTHPEDIAELKNLKTNNVIKAIVPYNKQ